MWETENPQFLAPRGASSLRAIAIGLLAEARDSENQTFIRYYGPRLINTEAGGVRSVAALFAGGVDAQEDEYQDCEAPQGGAAVAHEG